MNFELFDKYAFIMQVINNPSNSLTIVIITPINNIIVAVNVTVNISLVVINLMQPYFCHQQKIIQI